MSKGNGFSLIEVIVTLAIAAIVLSIGVPSFQSYIQNNRQTIAINELATALRFARNSAITHRIRTAMCKSSDGANCTADGTWTQGWIVFTDTDNNNTLDAGENILRVHGPVQGNATISGNNNAADLIAFNPQGILATLNGRITYCDSRGNNYATALFISRGGRVRFEDDGSLLSC